MISLSWAAVLRLTSSNIAQICFRSVFQPKITQDFKISLCQINRDVLHKEIMDSLETELNSLQSCTVFPCTPSIFALSFWSYTMHFETKLIVTTSLHAYILTKKFTSTIY